MLAKENPVAAIVAFGDMGTSSSTTVVTMELEKLGIPAVYMTAPPGTGITEGVGRLPRRTSLPLFRRYHAVYDSRRGCSGGG